MSFSKPNHLEYRNLMDSHGRSFLEEELESQVKAVVNLQRLLERITVFHQHRHAEPENPSYKLSAELNAQIFDNELEEWRRVTPTSVRNLRAYLTQSLSWRRERDES